ncbi:hypothetical protein M426DRAFT_139000 [Hypoxylon sp. CI-4A]|nr:hypothetical protein M426DRAFT_139000 [Hypoxylon sp. CI-4A]
MEEATKTIEDLAKIILPSRPHYLSLDTTRRYRPHPDDKPFEEQAIRPLQYTTFVSDADRGILLTRAYFDVREEPTNPADTSETSTPRRTDPNKPKTKLSLKDYKNKKRTPDGEEPPRSVAQPDAVKAPSKKIGDSISRDLGSRRDIKRETPDTKPSMKVEAHRHDSPSPEKKRRIAEPEHDYKSLKRSKAENATPNTSTSRLIKDGTPQKSERHISSERKPPRDLKAPPITNGKLGLSNTANKGVSPKPGVQVNGTQKPSKGREGLDKNTEDNSNSRAHYVPPLLSPIELSDYMDEASRPTPKKKPADSSNLKPPLKRSHEDREPSPSSKKRKIPPLLSPTLPPIVAEELALLKANKLKETGQKNSQTPDPISAPKKVAKPAKREETIHVESGKEQRDSFKVSLKYKKRNSKTVERLLALPPGGKKKSELLLKKEERASRDRSDSSEPSTARKRPIPTTNSSMATKRPPALESARPSTPPRQSSAMTRVASNSSQAGTPGVANGLTPATQHPKQHRYPIDPDKIQKLNLKVKTYTELATKLKHERDAVLKRPSDKISERERQVAIAAGIQCVVSFLLGFKLQSDACELERKPNSIRPLNQLITLFKVTRTDCARHNGLSALIWRLQGICHMLIGRIMWSWPTSEPDHAANLIGNAKDQHEAWRQADSARKAMGVYDGSSRSDDGGVVGKLVDRLGPWTAPEEAVPIALEVLRKVMQANSSWRPAETLTKVGHPSTNGITASSQN